MARVARRGALGASLAMFAVLVTATIAGARPLAGSVILLIGDGMGLLFLRPTRGGNPQ